MIGTSKGCMTRWRIDRLTSASPVARSAQALIAHSKTAMARMPAPRMTSGAEVTRPRATMPVPSAPTMGQ